MPGPARRGGDGLRAGARDGEEHVPARLGSRGDGRDPPRGTRDGTPRSGAAAQSGTGVAAAVGGIRGILPDLRGGPRRRRGLRAGARNSGPGAGAPGGCADVRAAHQAAAAGAARVGAAGRRGSWRGDCATPRRRGICGARSCAPRRCRWRWSTRPATPMRRWNTCARSPRGTRSRATPAGWSARPISVPFFFRGCWRPRRRGCSTKSRRCSSAPRGRGGSPRRGRSPEGELDVLGCLARRLQDKQIATELHLSVDGVRYRLRRIFRKLAARSRDDAVHRARERGVLPQGDGKSSPAGGPGEAGFKPAAACRPPRADVGGVDWWTVGQGSGGRRERASWVTAPGRPDRRPKCRTSVGRRLVAARAVVRRHRGAHRFRWAAVCVGSSGPRREYGSGGGRSPRGRGDPQAGSQGRLGGRCVRCCTRATRRPDRRRPGATRVQTQSAIRASPHFSPGAVMIAEDFGPVRVLGTESIAGTTVEGARARARARVYTGPKDPRGRGQRSP